MRIAKVSIKNFRGIKSAEIILPQHGVIIGDNNTGKTTILEALDLALGPDRLNRIPPVDEHDFFNNIYYLHDEEESNPENITDNDPTIEVEVIIINLNSDQRARFGSFIEFWNTESKTLHSSEVPTDIDSKQITEAIRVTFKGSYSIEEDDFEGKTYFARSIEESDHPQPYTKKDKQVCGFLYLRSLRTGARALSLERGSLLDIVLRIKEVRPRIWESAISELSEISIASSPDLGISPILESINKALKKYVPKEWGLDPHLKVSNLTRENLRKTITAFIDTGNGKHATPFYRQGTGTINMLVLALLTQIAEEKQNVIFAMEEPETAIPPYSQKRIVHEVKKLASQTLFTSHSPYVLEEYSLEETIILDRDSDGIMTQKNVCLPENVKLKRYRQEFRTRFCEGLLARRVLIAEGESETAAFPVAARRLAELNPETYSSIESLGVCIINAGGETNIPGIAKLYRDLGKTVVGLCDSQGEDNKVKIDEQVSLLLMHSEKGIENLILKGTTNEALKRFALMLDWPSHLKDKYPIPEDNSLQAIQEYFKWAKGNYGIADFLAQCVENEIPEWLRQSCQKLKDFCEVDKEGFDMMWS